MPPEPLPSLRPAAPRLLFVDALRAIASLVIMFHHFALYPPLRELAAPVLGTVLEGLRDYGRTTQVFFAVGGYVMARSLEGRVWTAREVGGFVSQRYCRLGLPYLAAVVAAVLACTPGRSWLPEALVGAAPTVPQVLAHVVFLQDILGYESLSAGLWFVCINFQLSLVYAGLLWVRDRIGGRRPGVAIGLGWMLAAASLFVFNRDPGWTCWAPYFFGYFFIGIVVHRAVRPGPARAEFWLYLLMVALALGVEWRPRLLSVAVVGLLLYAAEQSGLGRRWPRNRTLARLGRASYSLFLIHFPVLVLVSTAWVRLGWTAPWAAVAGLATACALSIAAALAFHRWVEIPVVKLLDRRFRRRSRDLAPATA
jgi:peptidoglycan/LPS O-acetylase OafA/YrhL